MCAGQEGEILTLKDFVYTQKTHYAFEFRRGAVWNLSGIISATELRLLAAIRML